MSFDTNQKDSLIPSLAIKFSNDYNDVMIHFEIEEQIYLTESLIKMAKLYIKLDVDAFSEELKSINDELVLKYRSKLKPFFEANMLVYFDPLFSFVEKIETTKEFKNDSKQGFNEKQFVEFLKMIIRYLENNRLHLLLEDTEEVVNINSEIVTEEDKIGWKGTQKELGELCIELERKGFTGKVTPKQARQAFTNSNTIAQVLKPSQDRHTKENNYENIYTSNYKPRFHAMLKTLKRK